jgi:hypothetical protein
MQQRRLIGRGLGDGLQNFRDVIPDLRQTID